MRSRIQHLARTFLFLAVLATLFAGCSQTNANTMPVATSGNKLVVYLVGLGEQLNTKDGYGYEGTFYSSGGIQPYLQGPSGKFKDAQSMVYSYRGFSDNGKPGQFPCTDTYNHKIADDVSLLNLQITTYLEHHPNTKVYLVGHSLGGVIAFGYMAQLVENTHSNALPHGGSLQGIAILDSPLNGVTNASDYEKTVVGLSLGCAGGNMLPVDYTSVKELQSLGASGWFQSQTASILGTILGGPSVPNQQVAEHAANTGVRILIVGNTHDLLWQPGSCGLGPNFLSTEFLSEVGNTGKGVLYVRSITSPAGDLNIDTECYRLLSTRAHHFEVVTDGGVKKAIEEVFLGQPLDVLAPVTSNTVPAGVPTSTPTPTPTPTPVPPMPTPTPAPVVSGTYNGTVSNDTLNVSAKIHIRFDSVSADGTCSGYFTVDQPLYGSGNFTGSISGNSITFTVTPDDSTLVPMVFNGTLSADDSSMSGTYTVAGRGQQGTWVAVQ